MAAFLWNQLRNLCSCCQVTPQGDSLSSRCTRRNIKRNTHKTYFIARSSESQLLHATSTVNAVQTHTCSWRPCARCRCSTLSCFINLSADSAAGRQTHTRRDSFNWESTAESKCPWTHLDGYCHLCMSSSPPLRKLLQVTKLLPAALERKGFKRREWGEKN